MALVFFLVSLPSNLAQSPTATAPLIVNQGPTARCYGWYSEPSSNGFPPTNQQTSCAGADISPGFSGSVNGTNGSPLTVSLTNNARNADCNRALEVNLSFDYPNSALYGNVSTTDLAQYDSVIISYDAYIRTATTSKTSCVCTNGDGPCPSWWRSWLTTDILFYQGSNPQNFNAISVRHLDPQNSGTWTWSTSDGYRIQTPDHQIASQEGAKAHVELDAKHLIQQYSNQLCQGGGVHGPIYLRSIQLVMVNVGTDMTVELTNVKANAFKYAPGVFSSTPVTPGPTGANCPNQGTPAPTTTSPGPAATQTPFGQCGGQGYTGPTVCPTGWKCEVQNGYYSQCLQ